MFKNILSLALLAGSMLLSIAQAAEKITVGLIATTSIDDTRKRWQPLLDDLAKSTGTEVTAAISANYSDIVTGLKENKIQIAWLSSKVALDAVEDGKATVFAQMVKSDGSRGYNSLLIASAKSSLNSFDDVSAKPGVYVFADGDKKSTSGYLVPAYYLFAKNKIEPAKLFKKVNVGNHQSNFAAILHGEADVATFNSEEMDRLKKEAPDQVSKVRVIWTSPLIPNDPILYRKDLSPALKTRVEDFFVNYGKQKQAHAVLKDILNLSGFQRSTDAQLKPIADLTLFSLLRENLNNPSLTDVQKQKKFDEVSARFGKLSFVLEASRIK
ncbi:phosphate/phosphite/phosphonate ABC transporter substrate-binding protein [Undibacterium sp. Di27W]|uniref:phosphate/phosphite/phosphonate ABC transporter substrate-binding protein n=1 Tax=Undibacterium sp. Di27W TaxID=3413036 RepID=UPI003BF26AA8